MIFKQGVTPEIPEVPEEPPVGVEDVSLGANITWFNTWNESQPLANVASHGRNTAGTDTPIAVDEYGDPTSDFSMYIYEGNNPGGSGGGGGSQFGEHLCSFNGSASSITGGAITDISYNSGTNKTTFKYTTDHAGNSQIVLTGTKRTAESEANTGVTNFKMMRPGHTESDFINSMFTSVMEPFSCFRFGPNWDDYMYDTNTPLWANRAKPDGLFMGGTNTNGAAAWETLIKMANELGIDLWVCIPPNADSTYLTKLFQTFMYGSDGNEPYTSVQEIPVWSPLAASRKLYFEIGNEIWNSSNPYYKITDQMDVLAQAEVGAGDANHYLYPGSAYNYWYGVRRRVGYLTVQASNICRSIVGNSNMMTRFRPIVAGQAANTYLGNLSLSYIRCVYGGYDWHNDWLSGHFPGMYRNLITEEDGVTENSFGIAARPIDYYVYGYATAPYINGDNISELETYYNEHTISWMDNAIALCKDIGIEPVCYEGGIEIYTSYTDDGIGDIIENQLNYWFSHGGKVFCYYSLAGNNGSGLVPDLTRQDPNDWPKLKAVINVAGLT
jgi:hypothetical protein